MISKTHFSLEHPLIKVPCERLNKVFRNNQKLLEKEMNQASVIIDELARKDSFDDKSKDRLEKTTVRLETLKRKIQDGLAEEEEILKRCKVRIAHPKSYENDEIKWRNQRLDRILVDHMLRNGYDKTAEKIATDSKIKDLVDSEVFKEGHDIIESLTNHSCTETLTWCAENRSRLKKMNSSLEFSLRVQEFIEFVRVGKRLEAIQYAKKYLSPNADIYMKELQEVMGCLAFGPKTACFKYKAYFEDGRWDKLCEQFRADHFALYSLTPLSLLNITLQSGLSVQKTRDCYNDYSKNPNCPVCCPTFNHLAESLPLSHRTHSQLVCKISQKVMSSGDPPMRLPSGYVYSESALGEMARRNHGRVTCPQTGQRYSYKKDLKKVFIM